MATFAQTADLEAFTGQALDPVQSQQALTQATALIQSWTGQTLFQVIGDTVTLDPLPSFGALLPEIPVTAVTSLQWLDDKGGTGWNTIPAGQYRFSRRGELYLIPNGGFDLALWPSHRDTLQVTYTHGYAAIPGPVYSVCLGLAARLLVNPFKLQSNRTGGLQVVYTGVREASELLDTEQAALGRYALPGMA